MKMLSRSFLLMAAVLVGAEAVGRLFFDKALMGRFDYGYNETAGFLEKPDGSVELVRTGGRRFFPQSFMRQRPSQAVRVMVVGDSVARGRNVASSYAGRIAAQLKESGTEAEGINLSLPGFGARRKNLVVNKALSLNPSLIILHVNHSNEFEDEREWRRREQFRSSHPKNWLMKSAVVRRIHEVRVEKIFWELLPQEVRSHGSASDFDAEINAAMDNATSKRWMQLVQTETFAAVKAAQAAGVPILLLLQANLDTTPTGRTVADDHGAYDWIYDLEGQAGVKILAMKEVFRDADAASLYTDSSHITPAAHDLMASAVVKLIRDGFGKP